MPAASMNRCRRRGRAGTCLCGSATMATALSCFSASKAAISACCSWRCRRPLTTHTCTTSGARRRSRLACMRRRPRGMRGAAQAGATGTLWALDLVVRQLHCLSMAGAHEAAVSLAGDSAEQWSHAVDFHFVVGTLMLNWACAQPQRAAECLPIAHASWQQCLALGDDARHDGAVRGRGGHLAAWNLMALHEGLGDAARATEYRELARILRSSPHPARPLAPGSSSAEGTRSIDTRVPAPATRTRATH